MIKNYYFIITLLFLVIQTSCEFEPSGTCFEDLERPEGEFPTAALSFQDSILILSEATLFQYDVLFKDQDVYLSEFYMDGRLVETDEDATGEILVDPAPGPHTFEMVVYTSTGSGSIAEKMGAEAYVYTQQWEILMEDTLHRMTELNRVYLDEKGHVRIEWEQSLNFDFLSYEILRINGDEELSLGIFEDRSVTSCSDPYYIGGEAIYNLRLQTQHFDPVEGDPISVSLPAYELSIVHADSLTVNLRWTTCGVPGNFGSYRLTYREGVLVHESTALLDTSVTLTLQPGMEYHFNLYYLSGHPDPELGTCEVSRDFYTGTNSLPEYEVITQSLNPPYMVHTPSFSWNPVTDNFTYHDFPDNRGIFAVTPRNRYLLSGNKVYEGEGFTTLNRELHHIPPDIFDHQPPWVSLTRRFDRVFFDADYNRYMYSISEDRITENYGNVRCWEGILSPDGYYLLSSNDKYNTLDIFTTFAFAGSSRYSFVQAGYILSCDRTPVFINDRQFVVVVDPDIVLFELAGPDIVTSSLTSASKVLAYDPVSRTILALSQESFLVYDIEDLTLIHERPITGNYSYERGHVAYMNKTVFLRGIEQGESVMIRLSF